MALECHHISKSFGGNQVLYEVDFKLSEKEILGVVGPNGAGKTTLINIISGFLKPDKGRVLLGGINITKFRPDTICKMGISRTFQIPSCFPSMTVRENIILSLIFGNSKMNKDFSMIKELAEFCGLSNKLDSLASTLNTSELKRLDLARALATQPKILLLDEFHTGLNAEQIKSYTNLLMELREKGLSLMIVEHNMKIINKLCDRVIVLNFGRKIAEGKPEDIAKNDKVIEAYLGKK